MGFWDLHQHTKPNQSRIKGVSIEFLHKHQCQACPLNHQAGLKHPHMPPHGTDKPVVYFLGESPGETEDIKGIPFVGPAGRLLRSNIPDEWLPKIRWNNVIRCRPPDNRDPEDVEIECCRPSITQDIETAKPRCIFGFGNFPLHWAIKQNGITKWNGRHVPVRIGDHTCWFFPMLHPSYLLHLQSNQQRIAQDMEFVFQNDLRNAFKAIDQLPKPIVHTSEQALENIEVVTDPNRAIKLIEQMYSESVVGWDYETNAERPYGGNAKILSVALAGKNFAFSFPIYHRENRWTMKQLAAVDECYKRFLYEAPCRKVAHHLGFEQEWSAFSYGNQSTHAGKHGCSLSQAFILDGRTDDRQFSGCLGLGFLTLQYFGINIKSIDNLDRKNLNACPLEQVLRYNAMDAKFHRMLYLVQAQRLKQEGMMAVYQHHLRRISTMVLTQIKGVPVDQNVVRGFHDDYISKIKPIEEKIENLDIAARFHKLKGFKFRPSAPEDIGFIVHNILNIEGRGADEDVLSKVKHPIAKLVLRHRKLSKTLSTYIKPYMADVEGSQVWPDGLLHPIYSTCRVRTWRTSSDSPNIQNVSMHNDGKEVRKQVKPGGNMRVVKFDYSGIQARNVAMESRDHALVEAFRHDYDIHSDWRERIAQRYPQWIDGGIEKLADKDIAKKYRQISKNLFVFPSFFGAGYKKLAQYLDIPEDATKDLSEEFWEAFPDIKKWHDVVRANYTKTGYVTGLSGFRRHAPVSYTEQINCVDEETECLTDHGWLHVDEMNSHTKIYTKNPDTGDLELQPVIKINRGFFKGNVHIMDGRLSSVTTPNHRWLVDRCIDHGKNNGGVEYKTCFVESDSLPGKGDAGKYKIHLSANTIHQKGTLWTDDEIALIGWALTDGHYIKTPLKNGRYRLGLNIMQSPRGNPGKVALIDALMLRLSKTMRAQAGIGKPIRVVYYGGRTCKQWNLFTDLVIRIQKHLPHRTLNAQFLGGLSTEQLGILYETMLLGDGSWDSSQKRCRKFVAGTKEKADGFSMLCVLIGKPHRIHFRSPPRRPAKKKYASMGNIPIAKRGWWNVELKQRHLLHPGYCSRWEKFNDRVWCPTTKNGTFVARRNGTVYITGNSPIQADETIIVCNAMARLSELGDMRFQANMMIHDDLTFIWDKHEIEKNMEIVLREMLSIDFDWINVPLQVEVAVGEDWASTKEIGVYKSTDLGLGPERKT